MRYVAFGFIGFMSAVSAIAQDVPDAEADPGDDVPAITEQFDIDRSDRMTVQVSVNGGDAVPFIVDTGAERTVIANDLARKLALEAGPILTLATISGRYQVNSFFIDSISTASVNLLGIEAPGLDRSNLGAYGLLGIDSLEDSRVHLDFAQQTMDVLPSRKSRGKTKLENGMIVVQARRKAGRMILSSAKIDGIKVDIILDTGAQSSMANLALRDKLRRRHRNFDFIPVKMKSVTGTMLNGDYTQIREIDVGGLTIRDMPMTFANNYAFTALNLEDRPAILLGMDALKLFDRVLIDFSNRRVGFDPPKGVAIQPKLRLALAQ
ncbi:retroviral-like aspartic protease family protein [Sphingorhabdus sp.]|uniref:retroviral-like aspartic protease family protein n=1 Tax=Sphingorhabdus sp. TaxID=1902408 RepID=UPI00391DD042